MLSMYADIWDSDLGECDDRDAEDFDAVTQQAEHTVEEASKVLNRHCTVLLQALNVTGLQPAVQRT
jgi:hypothetical protein